MTLFDFDSDRSFKLVCFTILLITIVLYESNVIGQTVTVHPVVSTEPTAGNADDPAIWIHPDDPSRSIIIGTDKDAGIYVYNMDGKEIQHIPQGTKTNNVDVQYDIFLGGQRVDVVAANLRDAGKLAFFVINPDYTEDDILLQIADKNGGNNNIQNDSYGFTLYRRDSDGTLFIFERPKSGGEVTQYEISGSIADISVTPVRNLNYSGGTAEGYVADDELGFVYITEEAEGIHKYYADPNENNDSILLFATEDGISGDREGLGLYACNDGTGYLVLSSQGNSTFKIYAREGNNAFLKTIDPRDDNGDAGLGTDGLDVISFAAPPNFPKGFLVAHDEGASRYHIYDWHQIAGNDLTICIDGRRSGDDDGDKDAVAPNPPTNVKVVVE